MHHRITRHIKAWSPRLSWAKAIWIILCLLLQSGPAVAATLYVWQESPNSERPYTNWASASRTIQEAVDAASAGDEIVVTNGVYATGGKAMYLTMTNRVAVDKPVVLRSVNGPAVTMIEGYPVFGTGAVRCVYLTNGAVLSGFTLTNGGANRVLSNQEKDGSGGGVWCESTNAAVSNCIIAGNVAQYFGGGVFRGTLENCTLTGNRVIGNGGGAYGSIMSHCTILNNEGGQGGGANGCVLKNCTLVGNTGSSGGGTWEGTLEDCLVSGNSAREGGGIYKSTADRCTLTGNSTSWEYGGGGGAAWGTLNDCTLSGNTAALGGGALYSTMNRCTLVSNWATNQGGGAAFCTLQNSALVGNVAGTWGGGASGGTLNHCTVTGNYASLGGGTTESAMTNCIVYFNAARSHLTPNYSGGTIRYCCTTPWPSGGVGNIAADPQLASPWRLSAASPCRGAGAPSNSTDTDIDGESRANPPSMGCDEYWPDSVTGLLSVQAIPAWTNVAVGHAIDFQARIEGPASASAWDFGDGVVVSNQPYVSHTWNVPGSYPVVLRAWNADHANGVSATVMVQVVTVPIHYVAIESTSPAWPFSSWASAARTIQDAVDAATIPGSLVLVSNGVYAAGGKTVYEGTLTNRVAVDKPVVVQSVNGPAATVIQGHRVPGTTNANGAIRCAFLTNGAVLSGFTLTNGATRRWPNKDRETSGGGVWCESTQAVVSNCIFTGNTAAWNGGGASGGMLNNCVFTNNWAEHGGGGVVLGALNYCTVISNVTASGGGGTLGGTLNHCLLIGNFAPNLSGGGASGGTLNNCTLTGNWAVEDGGVSSATLNNCIVYHNRQNNGQDHRYCTLNYCCATPLPTNGVGNFTNAPLFVDLSGGNLRLQSNSPCINSGHNAFVSNATDLDGLPRIAGGAVDVGAFEFQMPASQLSYAWLQQYGLPVDGSADAIDSDQDGLNNQAEWRCRTDPTNGLSALRLLAPVHSSSNATVRWQSVTGVNYVVERSTNLTASPVFQTIATNVPGTTPTTVFTDTNGVSLPWHFYRVGVKE